MRRGVLSFPTAVWCLKDDAAALKPVRWLWRGWFKSRWIYSGEATHWSRRRASLMRLREHRQKNAVCEAETHREKTRNFKGGKHAGSSPGWRAWTACFGLCVSWPATSCSRFATRRPGKRPSELKAQPDLFIYFTDVAWTNLFIFNTISSSIETP